MMMFKRSVSACLVVFMLFSLFSCASESVQDTTESSFETLELDTAPEQMGET